MIAIGTVLDKYRIINSIGIGSFSYVYLARHAETQQPYAIKQIKQNLTEKDRKTIDGEVKVLTRIRHPSIVYFDREFHVGNNKYLVFEYCSRGDLEKLFKAKHAWFSQRTVRMIVAQICQALRKLHAEQIVHRDLKLANILVTENYDVKLADFGFSKETENALLQTKCGTPITMAPEILEERAQYKQNCDTWSLGIITYQMLFNCYPWFPTTNYERDLLSQIKLKQLVFPDRIQISTQAEALIRRCLDKNPSTRPSIQMICSDPWIRQGLVDMEQGYTLFSCYNPIRQYLNKQIKSLFDKYWFGSFRQRIEKLKTMFQTEEGTAGLICSIVNRRWRELKSMQIKLNYGKQSVLISKCIRFEELLGRWRQEIDQAGYVEVNERPSKIYRKCMKLLIKQMLKTIEQEDVKRERLQLLQAMTQLFVGDTQKILIVEISAEEGELDEPIIERWIKALEKRMDREQQRPLTLKIESKYLEDESQNNKELKAMRLILQANRLFAKG